MFSFTEKDLDAVALVAPSTPTRGFRVVANNNTVNMDLIIAEAHHARSEYAHKLAAALVSKIKSTYVAYRNTQIAIAQLQAMSDHELSDIGVSRSGIVHAVKGPQAVKTAKFAAVKTALSNAAVKFGEWRLRRLGFQQLMAMDARQLSDIGLTRGEIEGVMSGRSGLANDNVRAANSNKDVKAS